MCKTIDPRLLSFDRSKFITSKPGTKSSNHNLECVAKKLKEAINLFDLKCLKMSSSKNIYYYNRR